MTKFIILSDGSAIRSDIIGTVEADAELKELEAGIWGTQMTKFIILSDGSAIRSDIIGTVEARTFNRSYKDCTPDYVVQVGIIECNPIDRRQGVCYRKEQNFATREEADSERDRIIDILRELRG